MHSVDTSLMDNVRKTAWEIADEQEAEAKKEFLEDLIKPSFSKSKVVPQSSINFEDALDQYDDSNDLHKDEEHPISAPKQNQKSNNLTVPQGIDARASVELGESEHY